RARRAPGPGRGDRRRLPRLPHDGPRARPLPERRADPQDRPARRVRAGTVRGTPPRPGRTAGDRGGRPRAGHQPARRGTGRGQDQRRDQERHRVHAVSLGGGEPADQPGARPHVPDAGVQGLRRSGGAGRMRLVVVGNGMAGARLVSEVRARDPRMPITVFGAEPGRPYNRVLLSNVLAGTARPDQLALHDLSWYETHRVRAESGSPVAWIDRESRAVHTADGRREPYDLLVIATGSEAIVPPIPGVERAVPFRTLDDCDRIVKAAADSRA